MGWLCSCSPPGHVRVWYKRWTEQHASRQAATTNKRVISGTWLWSTWASEEGWRTSEGRLTVEGLGLAAQPRPVKGQAMMRGREAARQPPQRQGAGARPETVGARGGALTR